MRRGDMALRYVCDDVKKKSLVARLSSELASCRREGERDNIETVCAIGLHRWNAQESMCPTIFFQVSSARSRACVRSRGGERGLELRTQGEAYRQTA
jgi:hypothetical protein